MNFSRSTKGEDETFQLGQELSQLLRPGDVVAITGELGAGKTTLIKAICQGFGAGDVSSPTFTIVNTYDIEFDAYGDDSFADFVEAYTKKSTSNSRIHHIDLYRIDDTEELLERGIPEYIDDEDAIVIVEWAEKFPDLFEDMHPVEITIEIDGSEERTFHIRNIKDR